MTRQCFLKCLLDSHAPIKLPHNVETFVGRSKLTKIKEQACSRQQLSIKADCDRCLIEVKQIGINPSGLDGFALKKDTFYTVKHGSKLEILLNQFCHVIEFDPPPEDYEKPKQGNKRKIEENISPERENKLLKVEAKINIEETMENKWDEYDNREVYIYTSKGVKSSSKIAAFDMDGTLIKTKSGKVYPVDTNDWQIIFPCVPQKLAEKYHDGYKIIILSNQSPIGSGRVKINDFKIKIENLVSKIGIPIQVLFATGKGFYRKPAPGMWKIVTEKRNDKIPVDMDNSFYCGDAAGRNANWAPGKRKDHSMADILLAENVGLKFYTPEQFFFGHSIANIPMSRPEFVPNELKPTTFDDTLISSVQELLVLVGYPGSGKSFIAKQIEKKSAHKYAIVCRDVLGSWQKCSTEAIKYLKQGKSVIIDCTNPDVESRKRWTSLASGMKVQCRCAKMLTSKAHAQHNNKFREIMKTKHMTVNDIIFNTYKSKFVEPSKSEGFLDIIEVGFNPTFEDTEAEKVYKMFLLEK